ncbi:epsin-3-like [Panicum hallii]|uniref:epsin-3-like n=1 Tax=Panicum hallii TaxID=206008 RepID=UPI000DF4DCB0|nr:epsin-3-like [Panicum hallii]
MAASTARWQLLAGEVKRQASGFLQDKYKQARLALGDVTPAELLVQEATNNDPCVPDAKTLACIADAAFDMDDCWRIAKVLHHRLGRAADWKQWRPVYKALVVLEFLLTHGPEDLLLEFRPDMPAMHDLRSFHYVDDKGFNWGACMQRRTDSILSLLTDADRLREARRRAIRVSHEVHTGFGFGFGSRWPATVDEDDGEDHQHLVDDAWDAHMGVDESGGGSHWSARLLGSLGSRASGFQSLSQPEQRRTTKKLQLQSQDY